MEKWKILAVAWNLKQTTLIGQEVIFKQDSFNQSVLSHEENVMVQYSKLPM